MSKRSQDIDRLFHQAQRLHAAGRLADAEPLYRQVLAAAPRHADALHALGALALQAGQPEIADKLLSHAIGIRPAATFRLTQAAALTALRRPREAADLARQVVRARPGDAAAWQVLGHALSDSGNAEAAIDAYREAIRLQPALPDIRNNLGTALRQAGRLEEAEAALRQAPADPFSLVNLSGVQKERGRFADAEATLRDALRVAPGHPVLRYNRALLTLLLGRDAEAWDDWEQRFAANAVPARAFAQPQWRGEPLNGRTLLVHAEQGLGDTIQFCRFLPALPRFAGGQVVFEAPAALIRLLASNPAMPPMVPAGRPLPPFDAVAPLLSLPARAAAVPAAEAPYVFAEPDRLARWRRRIGGHGFRIAVAWQGYPGRHEDKGRSLALHEFRPLAALPGVRLISVQKREGEDQIGAAPFDVEHWPDLDAGSDAFLDTAAVMMAADLVVTSDTSIAHLAGALGCPVWVALRQVPDWRWLLDRADSPWYPTMRLFRRGDGGWAAVFASMAAALAERIGR